MSVLKNIRKHHQLINEDEARTYTTEVMVDCEMLSVVVWEVTCDWVEAVVVDAVVVTEGVLEIVREPVGRSEGVEVGVELGPLDVTEFEGELDGLDCELEGESEGDREGD